MKYINQNIDDLNLVDRSNKFKIYYVSKNGSIYLYDFQNQKRIRISDHISKKNSKIRKYTYDIHFKNFKEFNEYRMNLKKGLKNE